ncbi:MAG: cytochrome b/b6 domain-containing protein [Bacteroidetes bacterium]|jgi:thiosulfate reductase cytochrome b subunit|nr:cytochrome b/b6 domain-containing protein [Bacteroidota bacterium]
MQKFKLYTRFERFWHWTQMALVMLLILTGFEIHGNFSLFGFENSVRLHNSSAWAFMGLAVVSILFMLFSHQYVNFIPTTKKLKEQIQYYTLGIFRKDPHPTKKSLYNKLNPLQRLIYAGLLILIFPVQIITGLVYMYYHYPQNPLDAAGLKSAAITHTIGAFMVVAFILVHMYMTTTGHSVSSNIKAMITGFEKEEEEHKAETKPNA